MVHKTLKWNTLWRLSRLDLFLLLSHTDCQFMLPLESINPAANAQTLNVWFHVGKQSEATYCHLIPWTWEMCYSPQYREAFLSNVTTVPLCKSLSLPTLTKDYNNYFPRSDILQSDAHYCNRVLQGVSLGNVSGNIERMIHSWFESTPEGFMGNTLIE